MLNPRTEPLKKVLASDLHDEVAWFGLGTAYRDDGRCEDAATALQQCVTVTPTSSATHFALAHSLHGLSRLDKCRTVIPAGIEVSLQKGNLLVTRNLEALKPPLSS
ncbi:MAG: hypothetical protein NNA18_06365 [Nitrospira sp.]|nr:hypothetical protein [Nitrospira sp.]